MVDSSVMGYLLAGLVGFVLGFLVRSLVHRCPPTSTDGTPVRLIIHPGPVTEQKDTP